MKILFMGTPEFALFSLEALVESGEDVIAVVTQPDKPKGRGYTLTPPPVKVYAEKQGIPVYQPKTLKDGAFFETLKELDPELIVVTAYGKILPGNIINYPKYGCINVHGSLLPKYRGAAPMQRAIINGEKVTGVTTMMMDEGLDTGDMLLTGEVTIEENDNFEDIHDKLGLCGREVLLKTLEKLKDGSLERIKQDDSLMTYAAKIEKEDCVINFAADAHTVNDLIRGLSPFPLALTHTPDGKILKIVSARIAERNDKQGEPGEVISVKDGIEVACGVGSIKIISLLPEGKGRMNAADFVRGRKIAIGDILL